MDQRIAVDLNISIRVSEQKSNHTKFDLKYLDHCRTVFQLQQKLRAEQRPEFLSAVKDAH